MTETAIKVGRIMRSSTGQFSIGTRLMPADVPLFGAFVSAPAANGTHIIGLIYDVVIEDDAFVRQLVTADRAEIIADQRQNRQIPIELSVLVVGHVHAGRVRHYLPPQPPITLEEIGVCSEAEIVQFTEEFTYFRTVLDAQEARSDEVLAASLRAAANARGAQGRDFLVRAGRELSRLLAFDAVRLEGLLRRIKP